MRCRKRKQSGRRFQTKRITRVSAQRNSTVHMKKQFNCCCNLKCKADKRLEMQAGPDEAEL